MKKLFFTLFFIVCSTKIIAQKELPFFQTDWGFEEGTEVFIKKAKAYGYDGIETWAPIDKQKQIQILKWLKENNMKIIFLCGSNPSLPFEKKFV